jgi:hypothetical protein
MRQDAKQRSLPDLAKPHNSDFQHLGLPARDEDAPPGAHHTNTQKRREPHVQRNGQGSGVANANAGD